MGRINCYHILIKNRKVFRKKGIPIDSTYEDKLVINGLGMTKLHYEPLDINEKMTDEELASAFRSLTKSQPWVGQDHNGSYWLYGATLDHRALCLKAPSSDTPDLEYVMVCAPREYDVHVLGDASVIFRRYDLEDTFALVEIKGASMIDLTSQESLVMIEPMGNGRFVCR